MHDDGRRRLLHNMMQGGLIAGQTVRSDPLAFLDPFRRAFGMPTPEETEQALVDQAHLRASREPRDVFATSVADLAARMPASQTSQVVQSLAGREMPGDETMRWKETSVAALKLADETIARPVANMDPALGQATARRALTESAMIMRAPGPVESAEHVLARSVRDVRDDVLSFMSYGRAAEHNAAEQTRHIRDMPGAEAGLRKDVAEFLESPQGEADDAWTLRATRMRLAMAQTGLLSPDRTVEAAVEASQMGTPEQGPLAAYDRRAAENGDLRARKDMLVAHQERTLGTAYADDPKALGEAQYQTELSRSLRPEPVQLRPSEQREHAARLIQEQLERTQAMERPEAILTGGQPGSGKSYIVNSVGVQFEGLGGIIKIDPDEIRPTLPYMKERIEAGDLDIPNAANSDAGTIAYQMVQIAKEQRRNVVIDGTLQNTGRAVQLADEMRRANYDVHFQGMATYPDLSHARTYKRLEEQIEESPTGFGRGVGDAFHEQAVKGYGLTVETFQKEASVKSITLHFGDGGKPVETRFVDGHWVPAVDMKATLDRAYEKPSLASLDQAASTWTKATAMMGKRNADPEEIARIETFRADAMRRQEKAERPAPSNKAIDFARRQAMQAQGRGG